MTIFNRTYGVELEMLVPATLSDNIIQASLERVGVACQVLVSHQGFSVSKWTVKRDGSVQGISGERGIEIVSPILRGEAELQNVDKVCRVMRELGATVNTSCGLHVHVGSRDATVFQLANLVSLYGRSERVIDALMAPSRIGNSYCRSLQNAMRHRREMYRAATWSGVASAVGNGKYSKLNIQAMSKGTVEFRQHAGTVQGDKVAAWVRMVLSMVQTAYGYASNGSVSSTVTATTRLPRLPRRPRLQPSHHRRQLFVELVTRPEGIMRDEIFARTGWAAGSLSITRFAREAGVVLRRVREPNGAFRYFGRMMSAEENAREMEAAALGTVSQPTRRRQSRPTVAVDNTAPVEMPELGFASLDAMLSGLDVPEADRAYWAGRLHEENRQALAA